MKLRSVVLCSTTIMALACGHDATEPVAQVAEQALNGSTVCNIGASCAIPVQFANQLYAQVDSPTQIPVVANGNLTLADRAQLVDASGQLTSVANIGAGTTTLGADSRIGTLWTKGNAWFGSRAYVAGTAWVGGTVQKQDGVSIVGGVKAPQPGVSTITWNVTFPATSLGLIDLQPNTTRTISAGRYDDVSVKSGATLTLSAGTYYFDSLTLESKSFLKVDNSAGTVVVYVRGRMIHRGTMQFTKTSADVLFASLGKDDIFIETGFDGTLIAPYAKVVIGTANGATHNGTFYGKNVEVQSGAKVRYRATSGVGAAVEAITPTIKGDTTAVAPPKPNTTGVDFEGYQKRVGDYIQSLVDSNYTGPVVEIPAHPDAQGAQNTAEVIAQVPPVGNPRVTPDPLPSTSDGTYEDARAAARAEVDDAIANTIQRLPEIDQTIPAPPAPEDPPPSTWATGFCPLESGATTSTDSPRVNIADSFFLGNTPDRSKTFDAYWNASGNFAAGLNSLYMVYAEAAFQTSIGASINLFSDPSKTLVIDILKLYANAEAGAIVNDGRLFSVPYLKAGIAVMGKDVKSWKLPEDISSTKEECRNDLNDCQKKGGVYDSCCVNWYGLPADPTDGSANGNRVIDTDRCVSPDLDPDCGVRVAHCEDSGTRAAGCIDAWTLAVQPLKVDLWNKTIDFLDPPIQFPIGPVTVRLNGGLEMGVPSYLGIDETGPDLTVAPFGRVFVKGEAEVGAVIYVAVGGEIDVIRLDIPFKGSVKWHFNQSPEVCAAEVHTDANIKMKWSTLNGKIYLSFYMRIWDPFFQKNRYIEIAKQTVFSWEGFSIETDPWVLAQSTDPIIKLNPTSCVLGGESCATDAQPFKKISDLQSTGQAFVQIPAPYGQKNCAGQSIVEFEDKSLGSSIGLFVSSTWDQGQTTAACTSRHSQMNVYVQYDEGKSDPGQTPSPYYNWRLYDQVTASGVEGPGGTCIPTVTRRLHDLPASIADEYRSTPITWIDLQRAAPTGRVTNVKVVSQATANCAELPVEVYATPTASAP